MITRALVFDLDGTLLDSLKDIGTCVNRVLKNRGLPSHPIERYRFFIGNGAFKLIERALPSDMRDVHTITSCLTAFKIEYGQNWNKYSKLYPGISEVLDKLTNLKIKLAVLSNKPHEFTLQCVKVILSRWLFHAILGQQDSIPPKPNPKGALHVASTLAILPSEILYLGDTGIDMETAVSAGMYAIGVLWGFRGEKELKQSGAQRLIKHPLELITLMESL